MFRGNFYILFLIVRLINPSPKTLHSSNRFWSCELIFPTYFILLTSLQVCERSRLKYIAFPAGLYFISNNKQFILSHLQFLGIYGDLSIYSLTSIFILIINRCLLKKMITYFNEQCKIYVSLIDYDVIMSSHVYWYMAI